jgi:hypothetical protein
MMWQRIKERGEQACRFLKQQAKHNQGGAREGKQACIFSLSLSLFRGSLK